MLLIWGWRSLLHVIGTGEFHCPRCGVDTPYRHVRPRRWFTFFFIPVIPLKFGENFVECTRCKSGFQEGILGRPTNKQFAITAADRGPWIQRVGGPRVVIAAGAILLIVGFGLNGFLHSAHSPSDGVGSCWKLSDGTRYTSADCNDGSATYRAVSQVATPDSCPDSSGSYLRSTDASDTSVLCLQPVTH